VFVKQSYEVNKTHNGRRQWNPLRNKKALRVF